MESCSGKKLLTVSVAAYNAEKTLGETLSSLAAVSDLMDLMDVIIVDDGSEDGTGKIADSFASRFPDSVRVVCKSNGGYGSTVNTAVGIAEGRYFKLLDADDSFDGEGLRMLLNYLRTTDADLVVTPYICEKHTEYGIKTETADPYPGLQEKRVDIELLEACKGIPMFCICVRTEVLKKSSVRLTEHCFYTDNEFAMAALLYSRDAVKLDHPVYRYRTGIAGQSMSVEGRILHKTDKITAAAGVFDIYENYLNGRDIGGAKKELTGGRKLIAEDIISMMVREVYVSHMLCGGLFGDRDTLNAYDIKLKEERPEIYEISEKSRLVSSVRRAGRMKYAALCAKVRRDEEKRMGSTYIPAWFGIASYLAAACMIVQCRTEWMHLQSCGMIVNRSAWAVMMASMLIMALYCAGPDRLSAFPDEVPDKKRIVIICLIAASYTGIFIAVNPVNKLRVIRCVSAVLMMIILTGSSYGKRKAIRIMESFRDLALVAAALSLILWTASAIIHILPVTGHVMSDWTKTGGYVSVPTFLSIYFEPQPTDWTFMSARNSGIFTEGPMAGFCYCIALIAEMFICGFRDRKNHIAATTLLVICVLSALSAVSSIAVLFAITLRMVLSLKRGRATSRKSIAVVTLFISGLAALLCCLVFVKITRGSGSIRLNDFTVGFNAWLSRPLFGGGFENLDYLRSFMPEWRMGADTGFSNSPMEILAQGGIYLSLPYIYAFGSAAIKGIRTRNAGIIAALLIFLFLFTFTAVPYQYIVFFMPLVLCICAEYKESSELCAD